LVVILGFHRENIVNICRLQHLNLKCIIFGHFGWQEKYPNAEPLLGFIGAANRKVNQLAVCINGTYARMLMLKCGESCLLLFETEKSSWQKL